MLMAEIVRTIRS